MATLLGCDQGPLLVFNTIVYCRLVQSEPNSRAGAFGFLADENIMTIVRLLCDKSLEYNSIYYFHLVGELSLPFRSGRFL